MMPPDHITCHHTGHKKKCKALYQGCWKWVQLQGLHPTTGEPIDEWKCKDAWEPILLVEIARTNRGQTQALESFRNEMVAGQQVFNGLIGAALQRKIGGDGG